MTYSIWVLKLNIVKVLTFQCCLHNQPLINEGGRRDEGWIFVYV